MPQKMLRTKDDTVLIATTPDTWTRSFGYKYLHEVVTLDGVEIGRVQTKIIFRRGRFPERTEVLTTVGGACVMGRDYEWLLRRHREDLSAEADRLADEAEARSEARLSDAMEGRWDRARFVR